jgi:hypothetical protein
LNEELKKLNEEHNKPINPNELISDIFKKQQKYLKKKLTIEKKIEDLKESN